MSGHRRVGIEKMWHYPSTQYVDLLDVAKHRGMDPDYVRDAMLVRTRSINPLWEDSVTLAINAAKPMLTEEDCASIELLIVGTETGVDFSKSISTHVQKFCGIQENCRNFESKGACHAGTSGVMMAAHWIVSGIGGDAKALVICTDQSRPHLGKAPEYVMGAGATAILISAEPKIVEYNLEHNGYWTNCAYDTFRPTALVESGNGEESLYCYMDALEGSYAHFRTKVGDIDWDEYFKNHIYHVPFGGITWQAHRTMIRSWKRMKKSEAYAHFERKALPALTYNSQTGSQYSGSTFLAMMGVIDSNPDLNPGDKVSIFSYGSGSCGEFYPVTILPEAKELIGKIKIQEQLDARRHVSFEEYEALETARHARVDVGDFELSVDGHEDLFAKRYKDKGLLMLKGNKDYHLQYDWA